MGQIAFVFPGQGAQYSGMGQELYSHSPAAKSIFDTADQIRPGTSKQCFQGTPEELSQTINTQPCLFCCDLAAASALVEAGIRPDMTAGFSLGELAALTFSGALTLEDGFKTVCTRGSLMHTLALRKDTFMAAVLKLEDDVVIALCNELDSVYPVNFNCTGQVTVSGKSESLEALKTRVTEAGGRLLLLNVSGGFHSPFMAEAARQFKKEVAPLHLAHPSIPVYSNLTAFPYHTNMKALLVKQIYHPVLWKKSIETMIAAGADTFIEVGPGKVLSGLIKRISGDVRIYNVEDTESLNKTIEEVRHNA